MSYPLYRWLVRRSLPSMATWILTLAFYEWLLISIYPAVAKSSISSVLRSLPQGLLSAFGLQGGHETLTIFLSSEFLGFIWILALAYFVASEASRLPGGMLEHGELTPLLMTPARRSGIALAAAGALLTEVLVVDALSLACAALLGHAYGVSLVGVDFFLQGVGSFLLLALVASIGIASSSLLPGERTALGAAGGIAFVFYALDFAARISPHLAGLEHLTPFAAYRPEELLAGHAPTGALIAMVLASIAITALASGLFARRDLRGA